MTPAHTTLTQQNYANAAIASSHIIKNYQQSSFQQQKPTHKPVIIIPQSTTYEVLYHIPQTTAQPVNLGKVALLSKVTGCLRANCENIFLTLPETSS